MYDARQGAVCPLGCQGTLLTHVEPAVQPFSNKVVIGAALQDEETRIHVTVKYMLITLSNTQGHFQLYSATSEGAGECTIYLHRRSWITLRSV